MNEPKHPCWDDLIRIELGRRDYEGKIFARCYFDSIKGWHPCFVAGDTKIDWQQYFVGSTLEIPGGTLYTQNGRKGLDEELATVVLPTKSLRSDAQKIASNTGGDPQNALASLLIHGFHSPLHEAARRMGFKDPRVVYQMAQEFISASCDSESFRTYDIDSNKVVNLNEVR